MKKSQYAYAAAVVLVFGILLGGGSLFLLSKEAEAAPRPQANVPKFEVDPFWPKPLGNMWVRGDVAGTCGDDAINPDGRGYP